MANTLRPGEFSTRVAERHGRTGDVHLTIGIRPELKDRLVALASAWDRPMKELVAAALDVYLKERGR